MSNILVSVLDLKKLAKFVDYDSCICSEAVSAFSDERFKGKLTMAISFGPALEGTCDDQEELISYVTKMATVVLGPIFDADKIDYNAFLEFLAEKDCVILEAEYDEYVDVLLKNTKAENRFELTALADTIKAEQGTDKEVGNFSRNIVDILRSDDACNICPDDDVKSFAKMVAVKLLGFEEDKVDEAIREIEQERVERKERRQLQKEGTEKTSKAMNMLGVGGLTIKAGNKTKKLEEVIAKPVKFETVIKAFVKATVNPEISLPSTAKYILAIYKYALKLAEEAGKEDDYIECLKDAIGDIENFVKEHGDDQIAASSPLQRLADMSVKSTMLESLAPLLYCKEIEVNRCDIPKDIYDYIRNTIDLV